MSEGQVATEPAPQGRIPDALQPRNREETKHKTTNPRWAAGIQDGGPKNKTTRSAGNPEVGSIRVHNVLKQKVDLEVGHTRVHCYRGLGVDPGVDGSAVHDTTVRGADLETDRTRIHNQAADHGTSGGDGEAAQEGDRAEGGGGETVQGAAHKLEVVQLMAWDMASEGEVADTGDRTGLEVGHVEVAGNSVQETVPDSDDVEPMAWKVATDVEELDMDGDKQAVLDPMTVYQPQDQTRQVQTRQ